MQRCVRHNVDLDSKEILQILLEFHVVEEVATGVPGDEEVQIAAFGAFAACERPKDAEIVRSVACCQVQDVIAPMGAKVV